LLFWILAFSTPRGPGRWQILNLEMDGEALASDLDDNRRRPQLLRRFRKRQYVVFAVLHNNTDASDPSQKASR
jgi:hypothetical protein